MHAAVPAPGPTGPRLVFPTPGQLPPGPWLLALSGGGDSVALLHLLLAHGHGPQLQLAYFDHHWGVASPQRFGAQCHALVAQLAATHGLPLHVGSAPTHAKPTHNAEATARQQRYAWLAEVAQRTGASGALVAHTQTDVVEGFFLRAGKGSGLTGLSGMAAQAQWQGLALLRPLLHTSRADLRTWLIQQGRQAGRDWLDDPDATNQRAKLRALAPQLTAAGVPEAAVAASVQALARAEATLATLTQQWCQAHLFPHVHTQPETLSFPLAPFQALPEELGLRVLAHVIRHFMPHTVMVRTGKRQHLHQRLMAEPAGTAQLGGVQWRWGNDSVTSRLINLNQ
jgi:tRNA(Ile)-lysidine synthase